MNEMNSLSTISIFGANLQSLYLFSAKKGGKVMKIFGIGMLKSTVE